MAILKTKSGNTYNTDTGVRTGTNAGTVGAIEGVTRAGKTRDSSGKIVSAVPGLAPGQVVPQGYDVSGARDKYSNGEMAPVDTSQPSPTTVDATKGLPGAPTAPVNPNIPFAEALKGLGASPSREAVGGLAQKYQQAHAELKGTPVSQDAGIGKGQAGAVVDKYAPPENPNIPLEVEDFFKSNPFVQESYNEILDYLSPASTRKELEQSMSTIVSDKKELAGLNLELANIERIMDGTEQDIRDEVEKAGGFATDSQVMALSIGRNKDLLKRASIIQDKIAYMQDVIDSDTTMYGFKKDLAQQQFQERSFLLNFKAQNDERIYNANKDIANRLTDYVGMDGLWEAAGEDPIKQSRIAKSLGMSVDMLQVAATRAAEDRQMERDLNQSLINQRNDVKSGADIPPLTPDQANDPFVKLLADSAGGKPLTDTSIQKLDKALTVLGQLGVLQTNVQDVKTGPLIGLFKGANPWDTNAQVIKQSLNAIVPNLARGVYGEVGVLTDNDIRTYSQTLPNLTSTEAVRNAVLYITLDMIGKSVTNTLQINAAAGRDVSGFIDIYTEMQSTKDSILSTIPGAQVPQAFKGPYAPVFPASKEEEDIFNSIAGTEGSGSFWQDLWNGLTGK